MYKSQSDNNRKHRSQNHRQVTVGRDLWRSSSPTTLLKQGLLEQAAQDCVWMAFEEV